MQISAHSRWRSMRTLEAAVVFHQFRKRHRGKTVDIRPGVQRLVHLRQQRPIDAVGVVVDMAIDQVTAVGHMVPGHHGIVAQDQAVRAVAALQQGLYAFKVALHRDLFHPNRVVVAHDQVFFAR